MDSTSSWADANSSCRCGIRVVSDRSIFGREWR
jgi:hypothetical protein